MKINYNVTGEQRKELVRIISETLGTKAIYAKMPTCNYIIGDITVEKDGGMVWDESIDETTLQQVTEALAAEVRGFGIRVCMVEPGDFATGFTGSRKNSQASLDDPDYGPIFKRSLAIIEKEENGGLKPEVLARRIVKLVEKKNPPLRNVVANLEQWLSTVIKRVLTGNQMVAILRDYYKS